MGRISTLILGAGLGAGLLYGALNYYVVRTAQGFEAVPKSSLSLTDVYLDTRQFTFSDWHRHEPLVLDIIKANKQYILQQAIDPATQNTFAPAVTPGA